MLGELIAKCTGQSVGHYLREAVFEPLDMRDSTIDNQAATGGRGPVRDLLAFATALADGSLLSPESQAAMQTFLPAEDLSQYGIDHGYGLGVERYAMDGMTVIGHMGTGEVGSSYLGYDAERGTALQNVTPGNRHLVLPGSPLRRLMYTVTYLCSAAHVNYPMVDVTACALSGPSPRAAAPRTRAR